MKQHIAHAQSAKTKFSKFHQGRKLLPALIAGIFAFSTGAAHAADLTWVGGATTDPAVTGSESTWNTTFLNWQDGAGASVVFTPASSVIFGTSSAYKNISVDPAGVSAANMSVDDDYSFTGGVVTVTGTLNIANEKMLRIENGDFQGVLSGSGTSKIIQTDASGVLNISANGDSYQGSIEAAGTLRFAQVPYQSDVTLDDGATLEIQSGYQSLNSLKTSGNATLVLGGDGVGAVNGLTANANKAGSGYGFQFASGSALNLKLDLVTAGTYTLLTDKYATATSNNPFGVPTIQVENGVGKALGWNDVAPVSTGSAGNYRLTYTVAPDAGRLHWLGGSGVWDDAAMNFRTNAENALSQKWVESSNAAFGFYSTRGAGGTITVDGSKTVGDMILGGEAGNDYSFEGVPDSYGGAPTIYGSVLTKTGGNTAIIGDDLEMQFSGADSLHSASVVVNEGRLQIGEGGASGDLTAASGIYIARGATFALNRAGDSLDPHGWYAFGDKLFGAGDVEISGGKVQLTGDNSGLTGNLSVTGGMLVVEPGDEINHLGDVANTTRILNGGTLDLRHKAEDPTATTFTSNWTLAPNANNAIDVNTFDDNATDPADNIAHAQETLQGALKGTGGFTKTGDGKLTLTGNNSYTGDTTVSEGRLAIGENVKAGSNFTIAQGATGEFAEGSSIAGNLNVSGDIYFNFNWVSGIPEILGVAGTATLGSNARVILPFDEFQKLTGELPSSSGPTNIDYVYLLRANADIDSPVIDNRNVGETDFYVENSDGTISPAYGDKSETLLGDRSKQILRVYVQGGSLELTEDDDSSHATLTWTGGTPETGQGNVWTELANQGEDQFWKGKTGEGFAVDQYLEEDSVIFPDSGADSSNPVNIEIYASSDPALNTIEPTNMSVEGNYDFTSGASTTQPKISVVGNVSISQGKTFTLYGGAFSGTVSSGANSTLAVKGGTLTLGGETSSDLSGFSGNLSVSPLEGTTEGGTLEINSDLNYADNVDVAAGTSLILNAALGVKGGDIEGTLLGEGTLTQTSSDGSLTFAGTVGNPTDPNQFTVDVNGTLRLGSSLASNTVTLESGATLAADKANLSVGTLALKGDASIALSGNGPNQVNQFRATNLKLGDETNSWNGKLSFNFNLATAGSYDLFSYSGSLGAGLSKDDLISVNASGVSGEFNVSSGGVVSFIIEKDLDRLFWKGGNTGTWDASAGRFQNNASEGENWVGSKNVTFGVYGTTGASRINIAQSQTQSVGDMIVTGGHDFTFTGGSVSGATLEITQDAGASTVIENAMSFSGAAKVNSGTLQIGNATAAGALTASGGIEIAPGATLAFDQRAAQDSLTFSNGISGTGSVLVKGGTVELTGANDSFSGDLTVADVTNESGTQLSQGRLLFSLADETAFSSAASRTLNGGALQLTSDTSSRTSASYQSDWQLADNSSNVIVVGNNVDATLEGKLAGEGGFSKEGNGTLRLKGINSYTGDTSVAEGTLIGNVAYGTNLTVASGATYDASDIDGDNPDSENAHRVFGALVLDGTIQNAASLTIGSLNGTEDSAQILGTQGMISVDAASGADDSFDGAIDGTNQGGFTKTGEGSLTLSGALAYAGGTDVEGGTLVAALPTGGDLTVASGATYQFNGSGTQEIGALNGEGAVDMANETLTVSSGDFQGQIKNSNELNKVGDGTLTLSGAQALTGGSIDVKAGMLDIAGSVGDDGSSSGTVAQTNIVVDNGASLSLEGSVYGGVTVGEAPSTTPPPTTPTPPSLSQLASATFSKGAKIDGAFTLFGDAVFKTAGLADGDTVLSVTGDVNLNSGSQIIVDALPRQKVVLLSSDESLTGSISDFFIGDASNKTLYSEQEAAALMNDRHAGWYSLKNDNNKLELEFTNSDSIHPNLTWTGAKSQVWDINTTQNWEGEIVQESTDTHFAVSQFLDNDSVTFDALAQGASGLIAVDAGGVSVKDMTVNDDYRFTGGGVIVGGTLTIAADKTLTLANGTVSVGLASATAPAGSAAEVATLAQSGAGGTLILGGENSAVGGFTGNLSATGGKLDIETSMTAVKDVQIARNGSLNLDEALTVKSGDIEGALTGSEKLTQASDAADDALKIAGATSNFTGNVQAKALQLQSDLFNSAVTIDAGGSIATLGGGRKVLSLATGGSTTDEGVTFELGGNGDNLLYGLSASNGFTYVPGVEKNIINLDLTSSGTYTLLSGGSFDKDDFKAINSVLPQGASDRLDVVDGNLVYVLSNGSVTLYWNGGTGNWDAATVIAGANFSDSADSDHTATSWVDGSSVAFGELSEAGEGGVVNANTAKTVNNMVVEGSGDFTFSGAGKITGSGTLTKNGSNTMVIADSMKFEGGSDASSASGFVPSVVIDGGTLQIGNGGTVGELVANNGVNVAPDATLAFNRLPDASGGVYRFDSAVSGTGTVAVTGGAVELTRIDEAALRVENGATLVTSRDDQLGSGSHTLDGGTLKLSDEGAATSFASDWTLAAAPGNAIFVDEGDSETLSGNLGGQGGFTKTGAGTLVLTSATNDYRGGAAIEQGELHGNLSAYTDSNGNQGANLTISAGAVYDGANAGIDGSHVKTLTDVTPAGATEVATIQNAPNLTVQDGNFAGQITGNSALKKVSDGTLVLSGSNDYSGDTTVSGGTLDVSQSGSLTDSGVTVNPGATFDLEGSIGKTLTVTGGAANVSGTVSGSATLTSGSLYLKGHIGTDGSNDMLTANGGTLTVATGATVYGSTTIKTPVVFDAENADAASGAVLNAYGDVSLESGTEIFVKLPAQVLSPGNSILLIRNDDDNGALDFSGYQSTHSDLQNFYIGDPNGNCQPAFDKSTALENNRVANLYELHFVTVDPSKPQLFLKYGPDTSNSLTANGHGLTWQNSDSANPEKWSSGAKNWTGFNDHGFVVTQFLNGDDVTFPDNSGKNFDAQHPEEIAVDWTGFDGISDDTTEKQNLKVPDMKVAGSYGFSFSNISSPVPIVMEIGNLYLASNSFASFNKAEITGSVTGGSMTALALKGQGGDLNLSGDLAGFNGALSASKGTLEVGGAQPPASGFNLQSLQLATGAVATVNGDLTVAGGVDVSGSTLTAHYGLTADSVTIENETVLGQEEPLPSSATIVGALTAQNNLTLASGASLTLEADSYVGGGDIEGKLTGSSSLNQNDPDGVLTIGAGNVDSDDDNDKSGFTGAVGVAGTLRLGTNLEKSGNAITLEDGATLETLQDSFGKARSLTVDSLSTEDTQGTIQLDGTVDFGDPAVDGGANGTALLVANNGFDFRASNNTVDFYLSAVGKYKLLDGGGLDGFTPYLNDGYLADASSSHVLGYNNEASLTGALSVENGALYFTVDADSAHLFWKGGNGNWSDANYLLNFDDSAASTSRPWVNDGRDVTFGDPAFSTKDGGSVKVDGAEKVRNMLVTGAGDFVFYGNEQGVGVTADDTGAGNGTLTIYQFVSATDSSRLAKTVADVDMTFHGAFGTGSRANGASVYVQSGALQIGDGTSDMVGNIIADHGIYLAGTQQTGSFSPAGGMLIFNRQGNTDFDGETTDCGDACDKFVFEQSVLGSGTVEVAGGKLLWLQGSRGANTFQGDVQVNGGTLVVTGDVAANTLAATASRTLNGGTLELARGNGAFDFNWTLAKNSGNAINVNSADEAGYPNKETLAGKLSGEGGFSKNGDGELVLTAANDYQGDTYANQGRLTGNIAPKTNLTVASGATYDGADVDGDGGETSARVVSALNGGGVIQNTNGFTVSSGNFSGSIDGSNHGGLTKVSDDTDTHGYLILSGSNDYSGLTDIQGGTLEITSTGSINHSDVNVASGAELELVGKIGQNVNAASGSSVNLEDGSSIAGSLNAAANSTVGVYGHSSVGGDLNASGSTMNFRLPDGVKNQETLLTVAGNANVEGTTVNLIAPLRQDLSYLTQGNRVNLIAAKNVSGATVSGQSQLTVKAVIGSALVYNFSIEESYSNDDGATDTVVARLLNAPSGSMGNISGGGTQPQPDTSYYKAWSEGFISSLALANQGGDVVANQAMRLAEAATNGKVGIAAFGTVVGGNSRYETGSHAKVKSVNGIAGISFTPKTSSGALAIGAFFEYGHGDYDTYNSFTGSKSDSHNGGNAHYVGGGFLAHYGFDGNAARADDLMPARGGYVEGSLRGGQMRNSFTARDLSGNDEIPMEAGKKGNYDTNSSYFSAHVGGGYVFGLGAKTDLDVYAKGFYTRQGGDKVTAKNDAKLDFDSANSTRLRVGARATRLFGTKVSGYAGLAYEREFSGKVNAKVEGYRIDAPQLKGNTGVGELGITVKPSAKVPLSVDFGVQGYVGEQRGVSGSLSLKYSF